MVLFPLLYPLHKDMKIQRQRKDLGPSSFPAPASFRGQTGAEVEPQFSSFVPRVGIFFSRTAKAEETTDFSIYFVQSRLSRALSHCLCCIYGHPR